MSKFSGLFEEAKKDQSPTPSAPVGEAKKQARLKKDASPPAQKKSPAIVPTVQTRTTGRRSDPSYTGAFAYIPAQLHEDVRRQLVGRKDLDFSRLVEQLLTDWLKKQK